MHNCELNNIFELLNAVMSYLNTLHSNHKSIWPIYIQGDSKGSVQTKTIGISREIKVVISMKKVRVLFCKGDMTP